MSKLVCIGLFIISIVVASFAQIILKKGASKKNIYINLSTITGYGLMVVSSLFTLVGYKEVSLSMGALLQALSFVFVPFLSVIILKEKINKNISIGIFTIILGIVIYSI